MLPFFLTPYPDEILYSTFARYHRYSRNPRYVHTSMDLFGKRNIKSRVDFPTYLDRLVERLPVSNVNSEKFILENTFFRLYFPFLSKELSNSILNEMKNPEGINGITGTVKGGIDISYLKPPNSFRFCVDCLKEDVRKYGEPYWHRIHQVSFIHVCDIHHSWLYESEVSLRQSRNTVRYDLIEENMSGVTLKNDENEKFFDVFLYLAKATRELFEQNLPQIGLEEIRKRYIFYLNRLGLITLNEKVRVIKLVEKLTDYYSDEFIQLCFGKNHDLPWVRKLFANVTTPKHPFFHLLLLKFLDLTPGEFFKKEVESITLFGKGPWVCYNPASDHYLKRVVDNVKVIHSSTAKSPVGIFSCSCGFSYSKTYLEGVKFDDIKVNKILSYGHVWEEKLLKLKEEGISSKEIGSILGVAYTTVNKYFNKLTGDGNLSNKILDRKITYQAKWLEIVRQHNDFTRSQLKNINKAVYTWLMINDREWYEENTPSNKIYWNEVEWGKLDSALSEKVVEASNDLLNLPGKPVWITKNAIARKIGHESHFNGQLDKLPETRELLNSLIESIEDYQIRRIYWGVFELKRNNKNITMSNLSKISSLSHDARISTRVSKILKEEVQKNSINQ
ncbi:TnsD family Tn7-like transposition protein [Bacillus sp. DJP31]|uniref:TnsD family Tn7-like transposition protein n=1 Tax=Bacillus sp. DJP31 TaxID=3409789 RepID=UPI003BB77DB0